LLTRRGTDSNPVVAPVRETWAGVFEDFALGDVVESSTVTITEAHVVGWASLTGDWHPLHMDAVYARDDGPFGQRVAHGPLVFAMSVGLVERANILGRSVVAWLGTDELRATQPVFIGDTLRVRVTVLETRLSRSQPTRGIVGFRYETLNQRDESVMACKYNVMIRTRSEATS
jgi:acyl dehydratase